LINCGKSLAEIGDFDSAVSSFRKAIDFNPLKWNAYSSWAHLEAKLNAHESACIHFERAFKLNPDLENSGDTHLYCYAYSLSQIGRYREALSAIDQLLSVCPIHETGLNTKAQILAILRRDDSSFTDEALKFFTERLLDNPSDMLARSELNLLYRDLGREKERRELIKETVAFDDPPAMALYDYAMLLERDGLIVKAITYLEWQALYDQKIEEIGFGLDYHSPKQEEEPYPSFDAPNEEWVAWLQRTTDFEKLEAEIQAGLYATTELSRQEREKKLRPPRTMTVSERGIVICTELIKVRSGLNDTLILSDRAKEDNYVQFTETICEVSSRAYASELPTLTKAQSDALQSLGFEQPDFSQGTPNYSMNWEVMSIKSVVDVVQQAFKILSSPNDFELVVEN
jgi:tetratricopeptide (TPR) repeat protein